MQPRFYLAITPRGAGVSAAVFYRGDGDSVHGWFAGARNHGCVSRFFAIERYFAKDPATFWWTMENDPQGKWAVGDTSRVSGIHCPLSETACHELQLLQSAFADEWLFYDGDPRAGNEIDAYRRLGLPVGPVNVRACQFPRFDQRQPTWTYASPDDRPQRDCLSRPALDARLPREDGAGVTKGSLGET